MFEEFQNKINSSPVQRIFSKNTLNNNLPGVPEKFKFKMVEEVQDSIKKAKQRDKFYYDRKTRVLPDLEVGQSVKVQINLSANKQ